MPIGPDVYLWGGGKRTPRPPDGQILQQARSELGIIGARRHAQRTVRPGPQQVVWVTLTRIRDHVVRSHAPDRWQSIPALIPTTERGGPPVIARIVQGKQRRLYEAVLPTRVPEDNYRKIKPRLYQVITEVEPGEERFVTLVPKGPAPRGMNPISRSARDATGEDADLRRLPGASAASKNTPRGPSRRSQGNYTAEPPRRSMLAAGLAIAVVVAIVARAGPRATAGGAAWAA